MSSNGATAIVLYPRKDGATFDLDYYNKTHMPLAKDAWTKHGLQSYSVVELAPDSQYSISAILNFESKEHFAKALAHADTKKVMDDVANFSSEKPVIVAGDVASRG